MANKEEVGVIAVVDNFRTFEKQSEKVAENIAGIGEASKTTEKQSDSLNKAQKNLTLSQSKLAIAAEKLVIAQRKLRDNTDPKKQQQLSLAVKQQKLAVDKAKVSVDRYEDEVRKLQKANVQATTSSKNFSSTLLTLGRTLAGIGILTRLSSQYAEFVKQSLDAASAAEEMNSKFEVVFKETAPSARKELEEYAQSVNRSVQPMLGFAATLQDTFVPLGFARDTAADMSVKVVKLANDLSSFNDVPVEQVVRDIQSALVGNTETLQKYGVVANQATIINKALELGLIENKKELDAQAKANAILQLLIEGTADAQGDLNRTLESATNVARSYEDAVLDAKIALGNQYQPVLTQVQKTTSNYIRDQLNLKKASDIVNEAWRSGQIDLLEMNRLMLAFAFGSEEAAQAIAELSGDVEVFTEETEDAEEQTKRTAIAFGDTGEAAERYALSIRKQARENVNAANTRDLLNAAHEAGAITDEALEIMTLQLKDGTLQLSEAQIEQLETAVESKERNEELNEQLERQRTAAVNAAISQQQLSESLVGATKARLAAEAIKALQQAMREDPGNAAAYAAEIEEIQLQSGAATEETIRFSKILQALPGAIAAGIVPANSLSEGVGQLDNMLNDVDIDQFLDEIGTSEKELEPFITGTTEAADAASKIGTEAAASATQTQQSYQAHGFSAVGQNAGQALSDGFIDGASNLEIFADDIPENIVRTFNAIPWSDIGFGIGADIAGGLGASIGDVGAAAGALATQINREMEAVVTRYVVSVQVNATSTVNEANSVQSIAAPQMVQPSVNNNNVTNNFNLEQITNMSPEATVQGFNTMRLLV